MEFINNRTEIIKNIYGLFKYLHSADSQEKTFAANLMKRGWVFVAEKIAGEYIFSPSRFAGYVNNDMLGHLKNEEKDGRETNEILANIYGREVENGTLLQAFKQFMELFGIVRNYQTDKTIRFFADQQNIDHEPKTYFISPTHVEGKKKLAWKSFWDNSIAAIGWGETDYKGWSENDINNDIHEQNYPNESQAIEAFRYFINIKPGDIIVATNVIHGIFGIGIATSSYKFQEQIHDTGEPDNGYSHYIDVAWLIDKYLKKDELIDLNAEGWWEPYGTISEKNYVPAYISDQLLLKKGTRIKPNTQSTMSLMEKKTIALNAILYGPPGTGKTYNTINKSLEILGFDTNGKERDIVKQEFTQRLEKGQIVFTTFHQNMSYEDFIEGIKPKTVDGKIVYEIEDGIFKLLSNKARFLAGNLEEVLEKFKQQISEEDGKSPLTIKANATSFDIIYRGTNVFYIQPHNTVKKDPWYPVNINNIRKAFETDKYEGLYNPTYIREILKYLSKNLGLKKGNNNNENKENYVLIIDEINRGNVSQIFGELITLIEEDKRQGNIEELWLTLPYSKEIFSVPSNVYIIGTMNTADRSVEALDTALRRRFSFELIPPKPYLLEQSISGIELKKLLEILNDRIAYLLDHDHQVGHSYFMGIQDDNGLRQVFNNKILPLLKEYFYNDFGKIRLVLGDGFVETKQNHIPSFAIPGNSEIGRNVYLVKDIDDSFDIINALKQTIGSA